MTARLSLRSFLPSPPSRHIPTYYVGPVWTGRGETRGDRSGEIEVKVKDREIVSVMGQKNGSDR